MRHKLGVDYAAPQHHHGSWWPRLLKRLPAIGLVGFWLAVAMSCERRASVNYELGLLRDSVHVLYLPIFSSESPIFETSRNVGGGKWRLMTSRGLLNGWKRETAEARVVSDLRTTLQAIALNRVLADQRKRTLVDAAWAAAIADDLAALAEVDAESK